MHSNTTNEIAVGTVGILFSVVAFDDPTLIWLNQNWPTLLIVMMLTMGVAMVTCLLSPAPNGRATLGRILASGIFGAVVTVIAGAMSSSGNGPAAIAAIVLICGIGGWMIWMGMLEYAVAMRESPTFKKNLGTALWNVVLRIFNIPRQSTAPPPDEMNVSKLADSSPGGRIKTDSEKFADLAQIVVNRRKEKADRVATKIADAVEGKDGQSNDGGSSAK